MSRIKQVLQHDESDCGPACVSIILQYYGKTIPLRKIGAVAGTDKIGTSGFGISKACETFGLDCEEVYISDPAICLIKEDLKSFLEKWSGVFFLVSEK